MLKNIKIDSPIIKMPNIYASNIHCVISLIIIFTSMIEPSIPFIKIIKYHDTESNEQIIKYSCDCYFI